MSKSGAYTFRMFSREDWSSDRIAHQFFEMIARFDKDLVPEKFGPFGQARYSIPPRTIDDAIKYWLTNPGGSLGFYGTRKKPLDVRIWIRWMNFEHQRHNQLNIWIGTRGFNKGEEWLIELGKLFFRWGRMDFGQVWHQTEPAKRAVLVLPSGLPRISWANFFGPLYVDFFGLPTLQGTPAYRKEFFANNCFLILSTQNPLEHNNEGRIQMEITNQLGQDAFQDGAHHLNGRRVPQFAFKQRHLGRPLISISYDPLTDFIYDVNEFIKDAPSLASELVTTLGSQLDYSSKSLDFLDDFILRKLDRVARRNTKEGQRQLINEIVAYYGEVLRKNLKGEWITLNPDGSQVHPAIQFTINGQQVREYPFPRIWKLWKERMREDGLVARYYLLSSGELLKAGQFLRKIE